MRVLSLDIDLRQLRRDALQGRVSVEQLLDLVGKQRQTIQNLRREIDRLQQRLSEQASEAGKATTTAKDASTDSSQPETTQSYSLDAEQRRRRKKKSKGRRPTEQKFAEAERTEDIYPDGIDHDDCRLVRERAVWRLEEGRAVRVGYRIFAGPDSQEPRIPGVTPRCEYGIEILVVLAFLVYIIGMSLDKACMVLAFFCQLPLAKSQADALLRQLAQNWDGEFDMLCDLIADAAIVSMDETGWKVGNVGCSLWAFASECQRLFLFGCHKDGATLDQILPPDKFDGIGVSDDAAVYRDRFRQGQKCWAHLLRKAIKLALLHPENDDYQEFLDQMLQLYRDAKRAAADKRLKDQGRNMCVCDLENRLYAICQPYRRETTPNMTRHERDFANLIEELMRLYVAGELFTFVLEPEVESTNNSTERLLRGSAQDRKAGRTNQTASGARRRSIIVSVLESLRVNLPTFTLTSVLEEVSRWMKEGLSLFKRQWQELQAELEANREAA